MNHSENLQTIIQNQQQQLAELKTLASSLQTEGLVATNLQLSKQVDALTTSCAEFELELKLQRDKNRILQSTLDEQLFNERASIISDTRERLAFYFNTEKRHAINQISAMESKYKTVLDSMRQHSHSELAQEEVALRIKVQDTIEYFNNTMARLRAEQEKHHRQNIEEMYKDTTDLNEGPLPSALALRERVKIFNMEMRIGSTVTSIIGVLLVLIGVVVGVLHPGLPPELRGAIAYALGVLFLAGGEFLHRRHAVATFFLGITAGGVSILFASTALAYFELGIISVPVALVLCVLTSAVAFTLALRYSSKVIACFALIGGYMPIIALSGESYTGMVATVVVYFVLLTVWALVLAIYKKWPVVTGISFVLGFLSASYIIFEFNPPIALGLFYLVALFLSYLGMILIYPLVRKKETTTALSIFDIVILAANTIISCIMIFATLDSYFNPFAHHGLVAIGFFAVYFAGAKITDKVFVNDRRAARIFYITAFVFSILIVPMQFGANWLFIGWFTQAVALVVYGVLKNFKGYTITGWIALALSMFPFFVELGVSDRPTQVLFYYTIVTVGFIAIVAAYLYAKRNDLLYYSTKNGHTIMFFRYFVVVQTAIYVMFATHRLYTIGMEAWEWPVAPARAILIVMAVWLYALGAKRIPGITDTVVRVISLCICAGATGAVLVINAWQMPTVSTVNVVILVAFNLFAVFVMWDMAQVIQSFINRPSYTVFEWLRLSVSIFALALVIMVLVAQFNYSADSIVISAIGMVAAFLWITFGFLRRYKTMRMFGLVFSFFSLGKLFIYDLRFLSTELRIVSFFVFGMIFLGISFVYQFLSRKMREKEQV